jgi:ATP-dependent protease ClpP protease subunit
MSYEDENVFFLTDFDDNMERDIVIPLTRQIQKQRRFMDGRIDLYINSFGGYAHLVFQLISLVEIAKREGIVVRTIVPDVAYSAGSILAIAGTPGERYIERSAEHLIHYGMTGSVETTPEQATRNFAQKQTHFKKILAHYKKYTNIPADELTALMNDDNAFIPAQKCIKWGIADNYMEKFDIGDYK